MSVAMIKVELKLFWFFFILIVLSSPLQVSDSSLILEQLVEIDMLTQEGDTSSVSKRVLSLYTLPCVL